MRGALATSRKSVAGDFYARLSVGRSPLLIGQNTGLFGKLTSTDGRALGGEKVVLQQRPIGAKSFRRLAVLTTASNGTFRKTGVKPSKHTFYRVRYVGNRAKRYDSTISPNRAPTGARKSRCGYR